MTHTRLFFNVTTEWRGDTLVKDLNKAANEIEHNMGFVLNRVGSDLIHDLQKHINTDVYGAYEPVSYPRRKDHPEFGTPLDDTKNFTTTIVGKGGETTLELDYNPDGTHKGKRKDTLNWNRKHDNSENDPLKPNPVHGDVLINRIQKGEGYDWECNPGKRPFWDNFIHDEFEKSGIKNHFDTAAKSTKLTTYEYSYHTQRNDLIYDGTDGMIETDSVWDGDDDLPF